MRLGRRRFCAGRASVTVFPGPRRAGGGLGARRIRPLPLASPAGGCRPSEKYTAPAGRAPVDKYLIVVLVFLIAGMGIAITKSPPVLPLFYTMLAGAVGVIMYSAWRARIEARRERERKRRR